MGFRVGLHHPAGKTRDAPIYMQPTALQIDILDTERHKLTPPHAAQAQGQHDRLTPPALHRHTRQFVSREIDVLPHLLARQLDAVAWIVVDAPIGLLPSP
mgnify:CR=1 FL=1